MKNLNDLRDDEMLTAIQASDYIPLSRHTLNRIRKTSEGPICTRIGGRFFYKVAHLKEYMKGEVVQKKKFFQEMRGNCVGWPKPLSPLSSSPSPRQWNTFRCLFSVGSMFVLVLCSLFLFSVLCISESKVAPEWPLKLQQYFSPQNTWATELDTGDYKSLVCLFYDSLFPQPIPSELPLIVCAPNQRMSLSIYHHPAIAFLLGV